MTPLPYRLVKVTASMPIALCVGLLTFRLLFLLALGDILPKYPEMFLLVLARWPSDQQ